MTTHLATASPRDVAPVPRQFFNGFKRARVRRGYGRLRGTTPVRTIKALSFIQVAFVVARGWRKWSVMRWDGRLVEW